MTVQRSDLVACWDFDSLNTDGTLVDFSNNDLRATPGAAGAAPTRNLDSSYSFNGAPQYFYLDTAPAARFYANAPRVPHTWVIAASSSQVVGASGVVFSCHNAGAGGVFDGIQCQYYTQAVGAGRGILYHGNGGGATSYEISAAASPYLLVAGRTILVTTVETTPRGLHDSVTASYSWGAGAYAAAVYDTAQVPRIGCTPALATGFVGRTYYLCLISRAITNDESLWFSQNLRSGVKPFAWRG